MERLEELKRGLETEVLVLLQKARPGERSGPGLRVLACAEKRGLATLNLFPQLEQIASANDGTFSNPQ